MSTRYALSEVYYTVQGEGRYAGDVMALVRLQGCSVGCPWCDTKHSWPADPAEAPVPPLSPDHAPRARGFFSADQIVSFILEAAKGRAVSTVLVTGGEPAEQNLTDLARAVSSMGWRLNIETSGTADGHLESRALWDWVCVSPKANMPGGRPILPAVIQSADELKFVVGKQEHVDEAVRFMERYLGDVVRRPIVSLQPLSASEKATAVCIDQAMKHGFRVSLQQHKYMRVP